MTYENFKETYRTIIANAYKNLKDNRFASFLVGEVRDKHGHYYNFVADTINAFIDAGFTYYNEIILVTCVGSLPLRCGNGFKKSRKLGKTHQNLLVFVTFISSIKLLKHLMKAFSPFLGILLSFLALCWLLGLVWGTFAPKWPTRPRPEGPKAKKFNFWRAHFDTFFDILGLWFLALFRDAL